MVEKKEGFDEKKIVGWINYLIDKVEKHDKEIEDIKKKVQDLGSKEEMLAEGELELMEKKK
jgi:hypothetical protein